MSNRITSSTGKFFWFFSMMELGARECTCRGLPPPKRNTTHSSLLFLKVASAAAAAASSCFLVVLICRVCVRVHLKCVRRTRTLQRSGPPSREREKKSHRRLESFSSPKKLGGRPVWVFFPWANKQPKKSMGVQQGRERERDGVSFLFSAAAAAKLDKRLRERERRGRKREQRRVPK